MWIWEQKDWPNFTWDSKLVAPKLREVRLNQGILLGKMSIQPKGRKQSTLETLLANIVHSSAIEGEKLNAFSVRSSLANKLGLSEEKPYPTTERTDGLAEIMLDAVGNLDTPLSLERLLEWHKQLFPEGPVVEGQLRGEGLMQVVSGWGEKPPVHFEAPSRVALETELEGFINWFNNSRETPTLDPLLRAAITHFWLVTLHPFDDGNGRITRLLTDLALAQAEHQSAHLYAMPVAILSNRKSYYEVLEMSQKGDLDITRWLMWFLNTLDESFDDALCVIDRTVFKTNFWSRVNQVQLHPEQLKVLNRMLDGDFDQGINTSQYHKVAKVSKPTASRHLAFLVNLGCLVKSEAGGRSTRYTLAHF